MHQASARSPIAVSVSLTGTWFLNWRRWALNADSHRTDV
jgi:hypothetical protein